MKTLPVIKRYHGFTYTQILRGIQTCIYEQQVTPQITAYEVFRIRIRKEIILRVTGIEKKIEAGEMWPRDEDFGHWAWSFKTYDEAKRKYDEIENNQSYV
jgi:hypothetical protein